MENKIKQLGKGGKQLGSWLLNSQQVLTESLADFWDSQPDERDKKT